MTLETMTLLATALKVGMTALAVIVLAIVLPIRMRRARARQAIEDKAILRRDKNPQPR